MAVKSEKDKMLSGELYKSGDPALVAERLRARELCRQFNALPASADDARRAEMLAALFGQATDAYITPPFQCDYGSNIALGKRVYFNFNCVVLDVAPVTIGDHVLIGPAVQIVTALHPFEAKLRRQDQEFGKPIVIGDDVWIGGGAIICAGVTIGDRTVIGAGSIVTRDIPGDVFAAGNPCRVVRPLS